MVQNAMPWIYAALGPGLATLALLLVAYWHQRWALPEYAKLGIAVIVALESVSILMLAVLTGPLPILSIDTYRPIVVSLRGFMLPVTLASVHMMASNIFRIRKWALVDGDHG